METISHHHHHEVKNFNNAFLIGIILNILFVIAEIIYGIKSDSLALISDAGHNLSDVLSLITAWVAILFSKKNLQKNLHMDLKKLLFLQLFLMQLFY